MSSRKGERDMIGSIYARGFELFVYAGILIFLVEIGFSIYGKIRHRK